VQVTKRASTLATFDKLDAISRQRALTDEESRQLEKAQWNLIYGPPEPSLRLELSKRGLGRKRRLCKA
jgi:hypothetical protein